MIRLRSLLGEKLPPHAGQVVTVHASDSTLTIDLDEGPRTVRRTTDIPISNHKGHRPRKADHVA
ncbi:hypothetical protein OG589_35230 [Sphaerisporangium sp. NBC_01403]|uniref:hypothetical protein n=1 Tax=Sphaerisporangium sp. NBC_01403 TaxID=2903599 RepID=UPI0032565363